MGADKLNWRQPWYEKAVPVVKMITTVLLLAVQMTDRDHIELQTMISNTTALPQSYSLGFPVLLCQFYIFLKQACEWFPFFFFFKLSFSWQASQRIASIPYNEANNVTQTLWNTFCSTCAFQREKPKLNHDEKTVNQIPTTPLKDGGISPQ